MKRRKLLGMLVGALACVGLGLANAMPVMATDSKARHIWEVQEDHEGKVWVRFPFKDIRKGFVYRIEGRDETATHAQSDAPYDEYEEMGKLKTTKVTFLRLPTPYEMKIWKIPVVKKVYELHGAGSRQALTAARLHFS